MDKIEKYELMNSTKKWYYRLTSVANIEGVSNERLLNLITMYKNPFYIEAMSEIDNKIEEDTNIEFTDIDNTILLWQRKKSKEIEDKWNNNIKYTVDNDIVSITIEFDIYFPSDWDEDYVMDWCGSTNKLSKMYYIIKAEMSSNCVTIPYNYDAEKLFLDRIYKNQEIIVSY